MKLFLRDWTINILVISVFISLLEIILPKSNMKKYIEMIVGLIIIVIIINPFIKLITSNINIEREVFANINKNNEIEYIDNETLKNLQENQTVSLYIEKVREDLSKFIDNETDYEADDIYLELELQDRNNYGKLKKISIELTIKNEKNIDNDKVSNIKKVDIKIGNENKDKVISENNKDDDTGLQSIKKLISDRYKIDFENVFLYADN